MTAAAFVALVTGANKGIGFAIAKKLCQHVFGFEDKHGVVYLGSRNLERGRIAVDDLKKEFGDVPRLLQLDVTDQGSLERATNIIKQEHSQIDVLVLNAAIAFKMNSVDPPSVQFSETFRVNYFGVRSCLDCFLPLLSSHGRVVILSSGAARKAWEDSSPVNQTRLLREVTTIEALDSLANELVQHAENNDLVKCGWMANAYANSKLLVTRLAQIEALKAVQEHPQLLINSCTPGWCRTDMAGWTEPPKTAEQGAETPFLLATLPKQATVNGRFYSESKDASFLN